MKAPEFDYYWHYENIRRIINPFVRRDVNAEDLVHDCIEKVLKNRHLFDGNKSRYSTWVYTVATQAAIDHVAQLDKDKCVMYSDVEIYSQTEICTPENEYESKELAQHIEQTIKTLPNNQQKVLIYADIYQKPLYEIADMLELKYGYVRKLYHLARTTINRSIEDYYDGG